MSRPHLAHRQKLLDELLYPVPTTSSVALLRLLPEVLDATDEPVPAFGKFVSAIHVEENRVWVTYKEPPKPASTWREPPRDLLGDWDD